MFDGLKRLFAGGRKPAAHNAPEPPPASDPPPAASSASRPIAVATAPAPDAAYEAAFRIIDASRTTFWLSVGRLSADVITYLISPGLSGGPHWPTTRQAFRVVWRPASVVVTSDGLSDPFDKGPPRDTGFGMELFVETSSLPPAAMTVSDVDSYRHYWPFALAENVAKLVAEAGGIRSDLDELEVISAELPGMAQHVSVKGQIPERFIGDGDTLGVLIGASGDIPDFSGPPADPIRFASIVLLTAAELDHIRSHGQGAREQVLAHLAATTGHRCDLERASAV